MNASSIGEHLCVPVTVRAATPADTEVVAVFNRLLAAESEGRTLDPVRLERGVRSILENPSRGRYWLAERNGAVCGQCLVTTEPSDWGAGTYWWLQSVYVDPDHRQAGAFHALWEHVAAEANAAGDVVAIRLYVERGNASARAVYAGVGMEQTGYVVYELPLSPP